MRHAIRKPAKKAPMTVAERQRKHRAAVKKAVASLTLEQKFRRELAEFVRGFILFHPEIRVAVVSDSLEKYGSALIVDAFRKSQGERQGETCEQQFLLAEYMKDSISPEMRPPITCLVHAMSEAWKGTPTGSSTLRNRTPVLDMPACTYYPNACLYA